MAVEFFSLFLILVVKAENIFYLFPYVLQGTAQRPALPAAGGCGCISETEMLKARTNLF
jgi:hypothetical protein